MAGLRGKYGELEALPDIRGSLQATRRRIESRPFSALTRAEKDDYKRAIELLREMRIWAEKHEART